MMHKLEAYVPLTPHRSMDGREQAKLLETWRTLELQLGQYLWHEGTPSRTVAILVRGELRAEVDGRGVGRVVQGEVIGETSMFDGAPARKATIVAITPATLLVMDIDGLPAFAEELPDCYDRLLDNALQAIVRRMTESSLEVARLSRSQEPAPSTNGGKKGGLEKLMRLFQQTVSPEEAPKLAMLLKALPRLEQLSHSYLTVLARSFEAQRFEEGDFLVREGEEGGRLFLLAEGEAKVMRHARGRKAEPLNAMYPGDLFGGANLVRPGRRTASVVATRPGWVFTLDRQDYTKLVPKLRRAMNESLIMQLGSQLNNNSRVLSHLVALADHDETLDEIHYVPFDAPGPS